MQGALHLQGCRNYKAAQRVALRDFVAEEALGQYGGEAGGVMSRDRWFVCEGRYEQRVKGADVNGPNGVGGTEANEW